MKHIKPLFLNSILDRDTFMKKIFTICLLTNIFVSANLLEAQTKPVLADINFLVSGQSVSTTGNGNVTVELQFDIPMDELIDPIVKFGLDESFPLTVPTSGSGWFANEDSLFYIWQGYFTISDINPSTADGEYIFEISNAADTAGNVMATTLSKDLGKSLFICRRGFLDLNNINSINFGTIKAGSEKTQTLIIYNRSCAKLDVTNITFSANSPFSLISLYGSSFTINGVDSQIVSIKFKSNERKIYAHTMTIYTDHSSHAVQLNGTTRGPKIVLTPTTLEFGKVEIGSRDTMQVLVSNYPADDPALSDTLEVTSITISNDQAVYSVNPTVLTIAPGFSDSVKVIFKPTEDKDYNNSILRFNNTDLTKSGAYIRLYGDARDVSPPGSLTNLRPDWDGLYGRFINSNYLPICWDNPSDPSGVVAIWWYFTPIYVNPLNIPEPDSTETIAGRINLGTGAYCANIPMFGRITSGLWYCYLWLEDSKGNRSWTNAVYQKFTYDTEPPGIPGIAYRSIDYETWFGHDDYFRILLNIPKDTIRNIRDAAKVFWKFKVLPTTYSHVLQNTINDTFRIQFDSNSLCGDDSLFIWLADSAGNENSNNFIGVRFRYDNCPPVITRVLPDSIYANLGQEFVDTLKITDDVGVDTAWVRYRFGGAELEEPKRPVNRIAGTDSFLVVIPDAGVTRRGIEYQVTAVDSFGIKGEGPVGSSYCDNDDFWYPVRTKVERAFRIDSDGSPIPLIFGEHETNYQLFSVPFELDSNKVMQVLEDDFGAYDPTLWRLFDYDTGNSRFLEGDTARAFTPGRSFFIITRDEKFVDSGPGKTLKTVCNDTIRVYEGWNLIASPFNFPIAQNSLSLINADTTIVELVHSYELGWNHAEVMEPWKGYAIYVTRPAGASIEDSMYVVVQPKAAIGGLSKAISNYPILQPDDWLIQISAKTGRMHDINNWVGLQGKAKVGFDKLELAEPPVIGKYIKVSFSHPEWNQPAKEFSTDIRPIAQEEQVWTFEVDINKPFALVNLTFSFLGDFPSDAEVHLIDEALKLAQNLRSNPDYAFKSGKNGSRKKLKLIVGSREFASEKAGEIALIPDKFTLLQNFPNPFNPETSIRYNIPEANHVKLVVYDLLGRQLRVLVNNELQNAGYYTVTWNGRDDKGRPVASGVYIYRISTNSQAIVRKMILLK